MQGMHVLFGQRNMANETNYSASVNELFCDLKSLSDAETPSFPTECQKYKTEDNELKKSMSEMSPQDQLVSLVAQTVKNLPAMQETWILSLGLEDPLKKEMETHSSILTWKIPWMQDPGRLQSTGL